MLAARKTNLITARARKVKRSARMLANARKDRSIPLSGCEGLSDPNNLCERGPLSVLSQIAVLDLFSFIQGIKSLSA